MQPNPELIRRCRTDDRKAHNELYQMCFGYLLAICLRYSNNREDARALLNNGFLKIITHLDKYREEVPFTSWVSRVMVNSIIDEFRRDKKRREHQSELPLEDAPEMDRVAYNEGEQQFDAATLEALIQTLPDMSRTVFNLYAIEGYTHKEIAEQLKISDGTSKWHVSFARKTLQEKLKKLRKNMMSVSL
jgi:RNA polymerase sigma-70 factor (ECF subfamily)